MREISDAHLSGERESRDWLHSTPGDAVEFTEVYDMRRGKLRAGDVRPTK